MIVLDYNEKVSINEVLEVLIGVGTFISTSTLQFQIIAPPPPTQFLDFLSHPPFLFGPPYLSVFQVLFCRNFRD